MFSILFLKDSSTLICCDLHNFRNNGVNCLCKIVIQSCVDGIDGIGDFRVSTKLSMNNDFLVVELKFNQIFQICQLKNNLDER